MTTFSTGRKCRRSKLNVFLACAIAFVVLLCITFPQGRATALADTTVLSNSLESGGIYKLQNVETELFMDVCNADTTSGTEVLQWYDWDNNNQKFKLLYSNNSWKLFPQHVEEQNMVLDIPQASSDDGVKLIIYDEFNSLAQGLQFENQGNGIYKIKTQASSYTKYLGVEDDSSNTGAKIVQKSSGSTLNWKLIKVGPTVEGITINDGESFPAPRSHYVFGDAIYVGDATIKGSRVTREESHFTSHYEDYDQYYLRIYRYTKALNAQVEEYDSVALQPGQEAIYTAKEKYSYTETYGKTIESGVSRTLKVGRSVGLSAANLSAKLSCESAVQGYISTTYSYSESAEETLEIGCEIYATAAKEGTSVEVYTFEIRATMQQFLVQIYKIDYAETTVSGGWGLWAYTQHTYTPKNSKTGIGEQQFSNVIKLIYNFSPYYYDGIIGEYIYIGKQGDYVIYV